MKEAELCRGFGKIDCDELEILNGQVYGLGIVLEALAHTMKDREIVSHEALNFLGDATHDLHKRIKVLYANVRCDCAPAVTCFNRQAAE
jgi:hypothetical protein